MIIMYQFIFIAILLRRMLKKYGNKKNHRERNMRQQN